MTATPVWQVDEWKLTASLDKIEQQWTAVREILEDEGLFAVRNDSVSGWSCGAHAGHISLTTYQAGRDIADNLRDPERNSEGVWTEYTAPILEAGDFPRGIAQSPAEMDPAGRQREEFLQTLTDAIDAWQALRSQEDQLASCLARAQHFGLGYMTSAEWVRFCAIHTAHHLAVVRDIRDGSA